MQFLSKANGNGNAFLAGTGDDLLEAWLHTGMAAPQVMAQTTWGSEPATCTATTPTLQSAVPGNQTVAVSWSAAAGAAGYRLYYDQAGKAQLVADTGTLTDYLDSGLTDGQSYCYKVTAYTDPGGNGFDPGVDCESAFSNVLCATPTNPGQASVATLPAAPETGMWVTTGKGKTQSTTFVTTSSFTAGDEVVLHIVVKDGDGALVSGAKVSYTINGPETVTLTSSPSDASGIAEASWQTVAPNRKGTGGTTPGSYTATTTGVTASGYTWDGVVRSTTFTIK